MLKEFERHEHKGKGSPSQGIFFTTNFVIRLDSKGRLVLPLEIRKLIQIETNGKILISVSSSSDGKATLEVAKAPENSEGISYSKNCKYSKKAGLI